MKKFFLTDTSIEFKTRAASTDILPNIVDRLPQDWKPVITVRHVPELNVSKDPQLVLKRFPVSRLRPTRLVEWAAERYLSGVESQSGYNLIHSACHYSLTGRCPPKRKAPFLLTVRDMIAEIFSHELDPNGQESRP